jgi:cyclophilin family peptidyl-prolyl cis-trans isomerase
MTRLPVVLVALIMSASAIVAGCSTSGGGNNTRLLPTDEPTSAASAPAASPNGVPSAPAGSGSASAPCPTAQPPALGAGQKRVVTIETAKGKIQITIDADLSPIAAGNFVALAGCGFYNGVVFHRVVTDFVIQGGDPTGTGTGGPGYTIKDEPVTATYGRGTVAMARTGAPNSVGSQFFIVLSDGARTALADPAYNNYQIIGTVTSGMEAVDAIAAAADAELPTHPIAMDKVTVSTP